MARSFSCHNNVSGPRQHFLKPRLSNSCSELCAASTGTLPPTTSQGSLRPEQHKPGFPAWSQYTWFYHLLQTDFHSFQHLLAFCIVLGLLRAELSCFVCPTCLKHHTAMNSRSGPQAIHLSCSSWGKCHVYPLKAKENSVSLGPHPEDS